MYIIVFCTLGFCPFSELAQKAAPGQCSDKKVSQD